MPDSFAQDASRAVRLAGGFHRGVPDRSRQCPCPGLQKGLNHGGDGGRGTGPRPYSGLISTMPDPEALNTPSTNDYLAGDGDGLRYPGPPGSSAGRLLVDDISAAGTAAPFQKGRITRLDERCLTIRPISVFLSIQDALIQSGGGTGPSKPRQPSLDGANA